MKKRSSGAILYDLLTAFDELMENEKIRWFSILFHLFCI